MARSLDFFPIAELLTLLWESWQLDRQLPASSEQAIARIGSLWQKGAMTDGVAH
ncbi:hypothetical protein [Synechococcus sp. PCC 7336]|uniref:hypothetical protein n=1 Tax=Synechococcus sp. PCC 7336 TaxID=195250 RepID=UPI00034C1281|nr:hypothetical protein [Synechococcus sp. PCC 7336]